MHYEERQGSQLRTAMRSRPGYQSAAATVFEQLSEWENSRTGSTSPRQSKIAERTGLTRETVSRMVCWLRRWGFIRTIQKYWRAANGARMKGRLVYWVAKEVGQVGWLKDQWEAGREKREQRKAELEARRREWINTVGKSLDFETPVKPERHWSEPAFLKSLSKDDRAAYWLERMGEGRANVRCDPGITTIPNPESYSDRLEARSKNSLAEFYERLRKRGRLRS